MTADRDPAVGALLDRLTVDPPPQAFWDDLLARVRAESPPVAARDTEGAAVVELHPVPAAAHQRRNDPRHRRRRVVAAVLAAAAVVAVSVVAVDMVRDDRDDRTVLVDEPTLPLEETPAVMALRAFMDALDAGDADAAWALLGPQSQEAYGGILDDRLRSMLAGGMESMGELASAEDLTMVSSVLVADQDGATTWLVTMRGTITDSNSDAYPFPPKLWWPGVLVQDRGDGPRVEMFVPGTGISLIELPFEPGTGDLPLVSGAPITVNGEPDADGFVVVIDGQPVLDSAYVVDGSGSVVAVDPEPGVRPGDHTISVAMVTADGVLAEATAEIEVVEG